jgi:lycopene cyclase domain-containing protein
MTWTYYNFLLVFLVVPITLILLVSRRLFRKEHFRALGVLYLIVMVYTAPWDNYAVYQGIWSFDRSRTLGLFIKHLPVEEYAFFLLQTTLVGLVMILMLERRRARSH